MRCLTLSQPYASLVALGAKRIETRSWATSYRGPLAIHAGKGLGPVGGKKGLQAKCAEEAFSAVLAPALERWWAGRRDLADIAACPFMPQGAIVATCELVACYPTCGEGYYRDPVRRVSYCVADQERAFGDFSPGRYVWLLADTRMLPEPVSCKGALQLWEPDVATALAITRQLIQGVAS